MNDTALIGVGNILEKDDGIAVYATRFLETNYEFSPSIDIINGGVEGINLLNLFMEKKHIIILDAIEIDDESGSIYHIPSEELTGYGLNSGGAHELGVLQCFDIMEMIGKELPRSSVIGIVPHEVNVEIGLSQLLQKRFESYIEVILKVLENNGITARKKQNVLLDEIITKFLH